MADGAAAADWVSGGRLPILIETPAQVVAIPRLDAHKRLRSVFLLNATIDATPAIGLRLRGTRTHSVQWIVPEGRPREIRTEQHDGEIVLAVPSMKPWSVGWLRL